MVQGSDNQEYLHKAFDGSTGWLASAGTIFLDASNASDLSDQNNALYGHHMNDGSMFASLADFEDQDTFDSHRDIYMLTPQGNYRLKTFALVKTTGSDAIVQTSFANDASYQAYVQDKLNRSVVSQKGDTLTATDIKQSVVFYLRIFAKRRPCGAVCRCGGNHGSKRPLPELEHLGDNWSFVKSGRGHGSQI